MRFKAIEKKNIAGLLDLLSLLSVLQYCVYRFLQSTMFNFYYSQRYKLFTMGLMLVFGGVRYLYIIVRKLREKEKKEKTKFILKCGFAWLLALPFFYVGWVHDYKMLALLPICCMCLYDMEQSKILKFFVFTIGSLLLATILCALSGTVRNLVTSWSVHGAYGIINTTDFAAYFTFLLVTIWCTIQLNSWCSCLLFAGLSLLISWVVNHLTGSNTALICGIIICLSVVWNYTDETILHKTTKGIRIGRRINKLSIFAFPFIGALVVALVIGYGAQSSWAIRIDELLSERLKVTWTPYQQYGIHPFGSTIDNMNGVGATVIPNWSSGYGYIDVGYAMLAIRYGWMITGIVLGIWVWMTVKALNAGQNRIALTMAILAVHAFSEARFLDVNYNVFLIMPFSAIYSQAKKEKYAALKEPKRETFISIIVGTVIIAVLYIFLPKLLSLLRTFFSLAGWNDGTASFYSLLFCLGIVFVILFAWRSIQQLLIKREKKTIFLLAADIMICIGLFFAVNQTIEKARSEQSARIESEQSIIRQVQRAATQPVYAAEPEELYKREIGGFSDHLFSSEELYRLPRGSIFTDQKVEVLGIISSFGYYTQISEWTGLYTFDNKVIETLEKAGYRWTRFYSGKRNCNLKEIAIFNNLKDNDPLAISGPIRVVTNNMEIDQFSGVYRVTFSLSLLSAINTDTICYLEVLGEAGERIIAHEELDISDFDASGQCVYEIEYAIAHVPKVSFAVSVLDKASIEIKDISWQKIKQ